MEINKNTLYILLLEGNKIFLHASLSTITEDIFNEYKWLYDYSMKYRPLTILDSIPLTPSQFLGYEYSNISYSHSTQELLDKNPRVFLLEIDKFVKQYMILYGMENVRGGTYTEEILDDISLKTLEKELKIIHNFSNPATLIQECKQYTISQNDYEKQYKKNQNLKTEYDKLCKFKDNSVFEWSVLHHLVWLYDVCSNPEYADRSSKENIIKYKKTKNYIKELYDKYVLVSQQRKSPIFGSTIYMKNPEFLFDDYFFHSKKVSGFCLSKEDDAKISEWFTVIFYTVYNRIIEMEFELFTFPKDLEIYVQMKKREAFHTPENENVEYTGGVGET